MKVESAMLHIGHGNHVAKNKILAITTYESVSSKRKRSAADSEGKLIDCTAGRKTKSLIHLSDGFIALSSVTTESLSER